MKKSHHPVEVSLRFRVKHRFEYGCTNYYNFFCTEFFLEQKGSNHLCKFHKSILVCYFGICFSMEKLEEKSFYLLMTPFRINLDVVRIHDIQIL